MALGAFRRIINVVMPTENDAGGETVDDVTASCRGRMFTLRRHDPQRHQGRRAVSVGLLLCGLTMGAGCGAKSDETVAQVEDLSSESDAEGSDAELSDSNAVEGEPQGETSREDEELGTDELGTDEPNVESTDPGDLETGDSETGDSETDATGEVGDIDEEDVEEDIEVEDVDELDDDTTSVPVVNPQPGTDEDAVPGGMMDVAPPDDDDPAAPPDDPVDPPVEPVDVDPPVIGDCVGSDHADRLVLAASDSYQFSSALSFEATAVEPLSDLLFDWSGLEQDLRGRPVDPMADVDTVALVIWDLSQAEFEDLLHRDELSAAYAQGAIAYYVQGLETSAQLFDFSVLGGGLLPTDEVLIRFDPEQYPPDETTYSVIAMNGGVLGQGILGITLLTLEAGSDVLSVQVDNGGAELEFDVTTNASFVEVSPSTTVDWSEMDLTSLGREWSPRSIDEVWITHHTMPLGELVAGALDFDELADTIYRGDVLAGDSFELSGLTDANGRAFAGTNGEGLWHLALMCSRCGSPTPWYFARLGGCD